MNHDKILSLYSDFRSSDYSVLSSEKRFKKCFELLNLVSQKKITDISVFDYGCGPGNFAKWLINNDYVLSSYYGYDIREATINYVQQQNDHNWINFSTKLPKQMFDIGLMLGVISYQYDDEAICKKESENMLLECMSFSNLGLIVTLPRADYSKNRPKPFLKYSIEDIERLTKILDCSLVAIEDTMFEHEFIITFVK